ncbi:glycosyltransferase family 2 protein [Shewanella algae]|uniref:glycosyltransferase family 2 protein n=1 Tax=Shewanella algae TaxID=38313 RepID=UPI0031F4C38F
MKKIYISVISHGHGKLIKKIDCLSKISGFATVVVKNNCRDRILVEYCNSNEIVLIDDNYGIGFGANNNLVYKYCRDVGMENDDLFLVLNPDVELNLDELVRFVDIVNLKKIDFSTINLYLDKDFKKYDKSIRKFPSLKTFVFSFIGLGNDTIIDKNNISSIAEVDWAAGSFLCFKASWYQELSGFDENYFMYCEDIDICYRSFRLGKYLNYIPTIRAVHCAMHSNRKLFSRHFFWHLRSAIRFLFVRLTKSKSNGKSRVISCK